MKSIMEKIIYTNMPEYEHYQDYRQYLRDMNRNSCSYCTITENESPGATFHIEHFRPSDFFPGLKNKCINLRYSCPRCNSYKSNHWIKEEDGCIRNCSQCNAKVCESNTLRFINSLYEEPERMIAVDENDNLYAINSSSPAEYTIKYLRLNRAQLIRLRSIRRKLQLWQDELTNLKKETIVQIAKIKSDYEEFNLKKYSEPLTEREKDLLEIIQLQYKMLILSWNDHLDFINSQLNRVNFLINSRL